MIGLIDCNNFFVSCERLFRPDLMRKPVAVLSANDGCIVARSQEVKDLGIPMGIPYFEIKALCKKEQVTLFSSNFPLYRDLSSRVMQALKEEFDTCEIYSIDEAFFTLPENVTVATLEGVRSRVMQKTGIPVSIGVAETKTLAKVANGIAKKETGVCILDSERRETHFKTLSCGSIWGIGRQTVSTLTKEGILTVADFLACDHTYIRNLIGSIGEKLLFELQGTSVYRLNDGTRPIQESYMSTRSFGRVVTQKSVVMSAIGYHVTHVAERLRHDRCVAQGLTVFARGSRFGPFGQREGSKTIVLDVATNDTFTLLRAASMLFDTLYDAEVPYKKAGISLHMIQPEGLAAVPLFDADASLPKKQFLNTVTDSVNRKYGKGTIQHAVVHHVEKWKEEQNMQSRACTTDWSQIATVKAT
jgi:DNA polymerase V